MGQRDSFTEEEEESRATRMVKIPPSPVLHVEGRAVNIFTTPIEPLPTTTKASLRFADGRAPIELTKSVFIIGRAPEVCDLSFADDNEVSRQHAAILFSEGEFYIEDLESTNGTFAGERRIWRVPLRADVPLKIGNTTVTLHCEQVPAKHIR